MRRVAVAATLLCLWLVLPAGSAGAAKPAQQGWWEGASPLQPVTDLLASLGLEFGGLNAVDVPPDGLLVQGGTAEDQPAAYAAVAFAVGSDDITGPLRLAPAPTAASVPGSALKACPLDNPSFTPAQGGAPETGPGYDCLGAVAATVAEDGAYLVDVTTLRRDDRVAVAILPAATSARVVFQAPGDDALPLRSVSPAAPGAIADGPVFDAPAAVSPTFGTVAGSESGSAALAAEPATGAVAAVPSSATGSHRPTGRVLILGVLALVAAALWFSAGWLGRART